MSLDRFIRKRRVPEVIDLTSDDEQPQTGTSDGDKRPAVEPESKRLRFDEPIGDWELELSATKRFTVVAPSFSIADAFSDPSYTGEEIRKGTLDLVYYTSFLVGPVRQQLYQYLLDALPWYRVKYTTRGLQINTPRFTTVFGVDATNGPPDSYSRRTRMIPPVLAALRDEVERRTGARANYTLVNFYADGKDSISWHQDSESFLGPNPTIASLSLGGKRDFMMRPQDRSETPMKWTLHSGDMVLMRGTTQSTWEHSIPKRVSAPGRINITFRRNLTRAGTENYYRYNVGDGPLYRFIDGRMVEQ